jgi:hypothetical protein
MPERHGQSNRGNYFTKTDNGSRNHRSTKALHIYTTIDSGDAKLHCYFGESAPDFTHEVKTINKVNLYVVGDIAFQAMALGREGMSPHHYLHCRMGRTEFKNKDAIGLPWTMTTYVEIGQQCKTSGNQQLGVKQEPWWPFIPLENYMVPILHALIGIGNQLLTKFCDVVNEYFECWSADEVNTRRTIPIIQQILEEKITERKAWDQSVDGKRLKSLQSRKRRRESSEIESTNLDPLAPPDPSVPTELLTLTSIHPLLAPLDLSAPTEPVTSTDETELKRLQTAQKVMTDIIDRSKNCLRDARKKIEVFRSETKKSPKSLNSMIFDVMKKKGIEITSYHGGSLTGKDIKRVMNNATYLFDKFAVILKKGQKVDCQFEDANIDTLCAQFKAVFLLWDGAFSLARTHHPVEADVAEYRSYVTAAVHGHTNLMCSITPKDHYMLTHVEEQMRIILGGLGDKSED